MSELSLIQGSIFDAETDCIVNPANSFLRHGGGLARLIADKATPSPYDGNRREHSLAYFEQRNIRWQTEQEDHANIPVGGAGWTSAGALPFKGIVHAVGPIWGGGHYWEHALLASAYRSACAMAKLKGYQSLAFPAISCGIFGFPAAEAAKQAHGALIDQTYNLRIELYIPPNDAEVWEAFHAVFDL